MDSPTPWFLNPSFLPAAFGLLGVIVGGVVTASSSYLLERIKEHRTRSYELKQAARIMAANLGKFLASVRATVEGKEWPSDTPLTNYSSNAWAEYENILAGGLPNDAWDALVLAMMAAESFHRLTRGYLTLPSERRQLNDSSLSTMTAYADRIEKAQGELLRFLAGVG